MRRRCLPGWPGTTWERFSITYESKTACLTLYCPSIPRQQPGSESMATCQTPSPSIMVKARLPAFPNPVHTHLRTFPAMMRMNPDIKGISTANHTYKLAAFADDILMFLKEPRITIPNLLKDFEVFQHISKLKINFTKSHALNISLPKDIVLQCQNNFPFQWRPDAIKYLGTQLTSRLSDLYAKTIYPFFAPFLTTYANGTNRPSPGLDTLQS